MIKLFIRNKLVEMANIVYKCRTAPLYLLGFAGFIGAFIFTFYVCGFLAPLLNFGKFPRVVAQMNTGTLLESVGAQIDAGSSIFMMIVLGILFSILVGKAFISIKSWISKNIELAKHGVKVEKDW